MATTHEQESFTPTVVLLYISKENTNTTEHSCRIQNIEENLSSCQKNPHAPPEWNGVGYCVPCAGYSATCVDKHWMDPTLSCHRISWST